MLLSGYMIQGLSVSPRQTPEIPVRKWWTEMDPDADNQEALGWQAPYDKAPRQRNNTDCGVMVCLAMRRLMLRNIRPRALEDWRFTVADGTRGRYMIINDLAANKIVDATNLR